MWTKYTRKTNKSGWGENIESVFISGRPEQAAIVLKAEFPFSNSEFAIDNKHKKPIINNSEVIEMIDDDIHIVFDRNHVDDLMKRFSK